MKKRLICLALAAMLLLALAACSTSPTTSPNTDAPNTDAPNTDTPENTTPDPDEPITTLQVFSMPSNTSGLQDNSYWAEILREDLNVQIEMMPAGDQAVDKLQTYMSAGKFPDIVIFKDDYTQVSNAIEAGLLINLDEHQAALPNAFANAANGIEYFRNEVSNGTGLLYALPNGVTTQSSTAGITSSGPYLRWDLYAQLGYPEIVELEDYLSVLQQMLDLEPTNPDGQKNYGISIWSDWDGDFNYPARVVQEFYGVSPEGFGFVERDYVNNTFTSIFDDSSYYKRALKFYYTANQMGLLDPDSLTHGFGDYWGKAESGRVMFSYWSWGFGGYNTDDKTSEGIGFKPVYFTNEKQLSDDGPKYIGGQNAYAISKDTQYLDKALQFVDYMYSYDGLWKLALGKQGEYWDLDGTTPYVTERGWEMKAQNLEFAAGGLVGAGLNTINSFGMPWFVKHPVYGYRMDTEDWEKKDFAPEDSALDMAWRDYMKADNDLDYLSQHNMTVMPPFAPMGTIPDDIAETKSRIADTVKTESWKMIFAKNDAEFEKLFSDMGEKAMGMGADTVDQWMITTYETALVDGAQYMK